MWRRLWSGWGRGECCGPRRPRRKLICGHEDRQMSVYKMNVALWELGRGKSGFWAWVSVGECKQARGPVLVVQQLVDWEWHYSVTFDAPPGSFLSEENSLASKCRSSRSPVI